MLSHVILALFVEIQVVLVAGPGALSPDRARELFQRVQFLYIDEVDTVLWPRNWPFLIQRRRNPFQRIHTLNNRITVLRRWEGYFHRRRARVNSFNVAILPPFVENGRYFIAGYANGTCSLFHFVGVAYSNAEEANTQGDLRFEHSVIALAHEIGHLGGMRHDSNSYNGDVTIMHPDVLPFVSLQPAMKFSASSKKQWRQCVGGSS